MKETTEPQVGYLVEIFFHGHVIALMVCGPPTVRVTEVPICATCGRPCMNAECTHCSGLLCWECCDRRTEQVEQGEMN